MALSGRNYLPVRYLASHRREETGYGPQASAHAAELAMHFERGQDYWRAVQYLGQAAENATQRSAYHEGIGLLTKGLEVLATLPETPARAQQELALQIAVGPALIATKGQASPEVERTYTRAHEVCQQVGDAAQLFCLHARRARHGALQPTAALRPGLPLRTRPRRGLPRLRRLGVVAPRVPGASPGQES